MLDQLREAFPQIDWRDPFDWGKTLPAKALVGPLNEKFDLFVVVYKPSNPEGYYVYLRLTQKPWPTVSGSFDKLSPVNAVRNLQQMLSLQTEASGAFDAHFPEVPPC